jgi:hypothetical protein
MKGWFNHHRMAMGLAGNLWSPFLKQLCHPTGPAPKHSTNFQFYMTHKYYCSKVANVFAEKHPNMPKDQCLTVMCKISQDLLAGKTKEVKARLLEEAKAEHEELLEAHRLGQEGLSSPSEQECEM